MRVPIRVLQVIGIMNLGGAETMIMNLYRHIDRSRIQFDFIENSFDTAAFDEEILSLGGRIYRCPHFTGTNYFEYKNWWINFFKDHDGEYKIIHGHIGSTAAIYLDIARKYGLYTIAHSHSSGTDHTVKSFLYGILSYRTRYIADWFFACSEVAGTDRYGNRVTRTNRFQILANSINTEQFKYSEEVRASVIEEFNLSGKYIIGHIGRFTSVKNHKFLLQIFQKILCKKANARLLLVGDGPLKEEIERQALKMGIRDKIIFTGVRSDVNRLIQAMDVFAFPSLYEGLPVTLVEVQTAGLPCIISDKVPAESILIQDLVTICSLNDSPEKWADQCLSAAATPRENRSKEVAAAGYDIAKTAKWLGDFYLEKYKQA